MVSKVGLSLKICINVFEPNPIVFAYGYIQICSQQVPRVFIGGKCIGGGTETLNLKSAGKMEAILKEAGAQFGTKQG